MSVINLIRAAVARRRRLFFTEAEVGPAHLLSVAELCNMDQPLEVKAVVVDAAARAPVAPTSAADLAAQLQEAKAAALQARLAAR